MDGIGKRVKLLRTVLVLNQGDFAFKIELSQAALSAIEVESRPLVDRNIKLICLTFNVQATWLRSGVGEMFNPPLKSPVAPVLDDDGNPLPKDEAELIAIYREFLPSNRDAFISYVQTLLLSQKNTIVV